MTMDRSARLQANMAPTNGLHNLKYQENLIFHVHVFRHFKQLAHFLDEFLPKLPDKR